MLILTVNQDPMEGIDMGADEYVPMCKGNFDYDGDVDGGDAAVFKLQFGRSTFGNPCPPDGPAPIEMTGQTTCFDGSGIMVNCTNTDKIETTNRVLCIHCLDLLTMKMKL